MKTVEAPSYDFAAIERRAQAMRAEAIRTAFAAMFRGLRGLFAARPRAGAARHA